MNCIYCGKPIEGERQLACYSCARRIRFIVEGVDDEMGRELRQSLAQNAPMIHEANLAPAAGEGPAGYQITRPICGKRSGRKGKPVRIRQRRIP